MKIRTVTVELLRSGPRYNQLLSRTTPYLAVCGDSAATTVTLPYEHWEFEHRLQELNYEVAVQGDPRRALAMLDMTGREIAEILARTPGLAGALTSQVEQPDTLIQLRIVFSASELAMLPFELTKVLTGSPSSAGWLALQGQFPVCITRHIRSVTAEGIKWPTLPRVLFVAGPDTPFGQHRYALRNVMEPWLGHDAWKAEPLVCIPDAALADVRREVAKAAEQGLPFSHVHVLAHGARFDDTDRYSPTGIEFTDGVVSGATLGNELTSKCNDRMCRPAVVTLASCDSARISDVRTPDASVAHDLHDKGIPLVVASQFQLSEAGAQVFIEYFYGGQLWGEHPLVSLYEARLRLSGMSNDVHDWAALVAYEAFPSTLHDQLDEFRYWQVRRAQDHALNRLEELVLPYDEQGKTPSDCYSKAAYDGVVENAEKVTAELPKDGAYALECAGLRAAGYKRLAQAAFMRAVDKRTPAPFGQELLEKCRDQLDASRTEYWDATKAFLGTTSEAMRRKSNLHWLLGQVMSLDVVRGQRLEEKHWNAARLAAELDADVGDDGTRAWARVSLAELALMRLADERLSDVERKQWSEDSVAHAKEILNRAGPGSEQAKATARQFHRYVEWWGNPDLAAIYAAMKLPDRAHWHREHGLVPTAKQVVELLGGPPRPKIKRSDDVGSKQFPPSATSSAPPAAKPAPTMLGRSAETPRSESLFTIEMLPAENGDCLWIEYGDPEKPSRVLIDCGAASTAEAVAARMKNLRPHTDCLFDLFVLTHIDADHINGVLPLFEKGISASSFYDIWFNGWRQVNPFLSVKQGEQFSRLLGDPARDLSWNRLATVSGTKYPASIVVPAGKPLPHYDLPGGMRLTLLSPGAGQLNRLGREWQRALQELKKKPAMLGRRMPPEPVEDFDRFDLEKLAETPERKDPSAPNGSSIGFLAEVGGRSALFTGDAHADVLVQSIAALQKERGRSGETLELDVLKLSHHGSRNATTVELLDSIACPRYLVPTNGNIFYHPDREAIARVILHGGTRPKLYFNYRSPYNTLWGNARLRERYDYEPVYPEDGQTGFKLSL